MNGFIYILTNTHQRGIVKIGLTATDPSKRALALSRQTGSVGQYELKWYIKVPNTKMAETLIHFKLSKSHYTKEYFKLSAWEAIQEAVNVICFLFGDDYKKKGISLLKKEERPTRWSRPLPLRRQIFKEGLTIISNLKKLEKKVYLNREIKVKWSEVLPEFTYFFDVKALELILTEGKVGDPAKRYFEKYRENYYGFKQIDLAFKKEFLEVKLIGYRNSKFNQLKRILNFFFRNIKAKIIPTAIGYKLIIKTVDEFVLLADFLEMGHKSPASTFDTGLFKAVPEGLGEKPGNYGY